MTDAFTPAPSDDTSIDTSIDTVLDTTIDAIERDLADVEAALARLDAGTYWTDEVTGRPLPSDLLAAQPLARRDPLA